MRQGETERETERNRVTERQRNTDRDKERAHEVEKHRDTARKTKKMTMKILSRWKESVGRRAKGSEGNDNEQHEQSANERDTAKWMASTVRLTERRWAAARPRHHGRLMQGLMN